jgi:hypothetical protein
MSERQRRSLAEKKKKKRKKKKSPSELAATVVGIEGGLALLSF